MLENEQDNLNEEQITEQQPPAEAEARPPGRRGGRGGRRRAPASKAGATESDVVESDATNLTDRLDAPEEPDARETSETSNSSPLAAASGSEAEDAADSSETPPAKAAPARSTAKKAAPKTSAKTPAKASDKTPAKASGKTSPAKKLAMFISVLPGEQVEAAIAENGVLREYYVEMLHQAKTRGNIYKGVINNIDTNLQAAFVNYGADKNGFLQIDEVHPE